MHECLGVVTGTRLNITEQEIVDKKRIFRLHHIFVYIHSRRAVTGILDGD